MHGGSGVSAENYREVIKRGVRKVNYYTYMAKAGGEAVSNKEYAQFHDVLLDAEKAMMKNVKSAIEIFSESGKWFLSYLMKYAGNWAGKSWNDFPAHNCILAEWSDLRRGFRKATVLQIICPLNR